MRARAVVVAAAAVALGGCGGGSAPTPAVPGSPLHLSSPAFPAGGVIPRLYTCDGRDVSPPLRWSGVPGGARELTLVMRDPDAPGGDFIHWTLTGIAPATTGVAAGRVPAGVAQGRNGFGTIGYRGPCPPPGEEPHHYLITLTALSGRTVLGVGTLSGTYDRR